MIRINVITLFLSILVLCPGIKAQDYKAASLWDANGNVKEIKYKTKDPLMKKKKMKFEKDGKLKSNVMTYEDNGYPCGIDMNFGVVAFSVKFTYSSSKPHLLENVVMDTKVRNDYNSYDITFSYEGDVPVKRVINAQKKGDDPASFEWTSTFSNYKFDPKGNWISRDVEMKGRNLTDSTTKESSFTETRELTYWQ